MTVQPRRQYTDEFKAQIVELANHGRPVSELAREFDLNTSTRPITGTFDVKEGADVLGCAEGLPNTEVRVSYDTNFRPRLWTAEAARPVIEAAARNADILKTSVEDCEALLGLLTKPAKRKKRAG